MEQMACSKWHTRPTQSGDIMKKKQLDIDAYRAELESQDDEKLFGVDGLLELEEERRKQLIEDRIEDYENELDELDVADLYGDEEWKKRRSEMIEELVNERLQDLEQSGR
jgi:hypothetical protein